MVWSGRCTSLWDSRILPTVALGRSRTDEDEQWDCQRSSLKIGFDNPPWLRRWPMCCFRCSWSCLLALELDMENARQDVWRTLLWACRARQVTSLLICPSTPLNEHPNRIMPSSQTIHLSQTRGVLLAVTRTSLTPLRCPTATRSTLGKGPMPAAQCVAPPVAPRPARPCLGSS